MYKRQQITNSIVTEALFVGIFATITGIALGFPIAFGLQELLAALNFGPDENSLPLRPTTVIVGAILGIGLTLAAAVWPALRARSISPMAALRSGLSTAYTIPKNFLVGSILTTIGLFTIILGFIFDEWLIMLPLGVLAGIFLFLSLIHI